MLQSLSADQGIAADRLRRWVSAMILVGALDRAGGDEHRFLLKGGVAMELRLNVSARTTKDVDIIAIPEGSVDIVEALEGALIVPYQGFAFRLTEAHSIGATKVQRMNVKLTYKRKAWATLRLEASPPEAGAAELEEISAFSLTELGFDGPTQVACQSLRYQIATKLHAVTERFADQSNDRFRDLIDLLLLRDLEPDLTLVAAACRDVFAIRATHPWPPVLTVESAWPVQFRALAIDQDFAIHDVFDAASSVQAFIDDIADAS